MKKVDQVTQSIDDLDPEVLRKAKARLQRADQSLYAKPGKHAAFREWRKKLRRGETLPRGE